MLIGWWCSGRVQRLVHDGLWCGYGHLGVRDLFPGLLDFSVDEHFALG